MPNQPKTPHRTLRIDDELWNAFGALAADRSEVIRAFIRWYVRAEGAQLPRRPREPQLPWRPPAADPAD